MKREIPILLTIICGLLITGSFFAGDGDGLNFMQAVNTELLQWALIFFSVAFVLGIWNLVRISLKQIAARHPDAPYKIILLVTLFGYLILGMGEIEGLWGGSDANTIGLRIWVYNKMFIPLQATMFSLLAFFIASAAFRAFRARSLESTLLLTAGVIVMLGQVPIGDEFTNWITFGQTESLASRSLAWLMVYVNGAGQKAIIIGATLCVLATGLRIVLGIERSYLSE